MTAISYRHQKQYTARYGSGPIVKTNRVFVQFSASRVKENIMYFTYQRMLTKVCKNFRSPLYAFRWTGKPYPKLSPPQLWEEYQKMILHFSIISIIIYRLSRLYIIYRFRLSSLTHNTSHCWARFFFTVSETYYTKHSGIQTIDL